MMNPYQQKGYNFLICQIKLNNISLSMQLKNTSNGVRNLVIFLDASVL